MNQLLSLTTISQELSHSLQSLQPQNEAGKLITYTLMATALVGIFVYNYIKNQEANGT